VVKGKLQEGVLSEVMKDVFAVMPQVYKNFWNFQEVADFILLSYVVKGQVSDFETYKEVKGYIIDVLKEGLQNFKNGGMI
jgi:hypothetical protein